MCIIDNISSIMLAKGLEQKALTDYLGISNGVFTDWKSGRLKSYKKYLPQIAEFLGVSVGYLLGEEDKKIPGEIKLTEDEAEWLSLFREVPEESKGLLLETFKTFRKIPQDHQPEALNLLQVALRMQQKSE